jgi:hypothetical protein
MAEAKEPRRGGAVLHADQGLARAIQAVDTEDSRRARGVEEAHAARIELHREDALRVVGDEEPLAVRAQGQPLQRDERLAAGDRLEGAAAGREPIEGG